MSSPAVSSFHFDADDLPEQDRFATWREVISATHDVALLATESSPFHLNYDLWQLGYIAVSSGSFPA